MSNPAPSRLAFRDIFTMICSAAGLATLVAGSIYAYGGRATQLDENTRAIAKLEAADVAKAELLSKIDGRTIRIETKLEMIAPAKGAQP